MKSEMSTETQALAPPAAEGAGKGAGEAVAEGAELLPEGRKKKEKKKRKQLSDAKAPGGRSGGRRLFGVRVSSLLLVCYVAAFLGWWVENIFRIISIGVFNDRHQLLPFLAAYGFGIFVLFVVFGTPTEMRIFSKRILPENTKRNRILRVVVYYVLVFALILFGEMGVGLLFEALFGVHAWNYNSIPLHITQYTSIPTTFGFATGITLLMQFMFRPTVRRLERIPQKPAFWLALAFGVLIAADYVVMIGTAVITNGLPNYWEVIFW